MGFAKIFECFIGDILPLETAAPVVARLRHISRLVHAGPNASVQIEGEDDHYVYLARGNAKLVAQGTGGHQQVLEFHFAGDLLLVPGHSAHGISLDAISRCDLLVMSAADALEVARDDAALAVVLLERMTAWLTRSRDLVITLGRKRAMERVAGFLLSIRDRVTPVAATSGQFLLPMSRRDIGDNLAITVESISREVGRLRREQVIETPARAQVQILDPTSLAEHAGFFAGAA